MSTFHDMFHDMFHECELLSGVSWSGVPSRGVEQLTNWIDARRVMKTFPKEWGTRCCGYSEHFRVSAHRFIRLHDLTPKRRCAPFRRWSGSVESSSASHAASFTNWASCILRTQSNSDEFYALFARVFPW